MKMFELENILINSKIPLEFYSLKGGLPNEEFCIGYQNHQWEVYYSERGHKSSLKIFSAEEDACDYFYKRLIEGLENQFGKRYTS